MWEIRCLRAIAMLRSTFRAAALIAVALQGVAWAQNPIVVENQQPGSNAWVFDGTNSQVLGTDSVGQIKGYASATSVNKGQNITFFVTVNPSQTYTIDVFRMGWYQGLGGRLMQHIGPLSGLQQAACPTDSTTGMLECRWNPSFTLSTQSTWTSGVYLALLTNATGYKNYIIFAVRDDTRVAALLYKQPVTTYQAYNDYPYDSKTGKSLYTFDSYGANTISGSAAAVKVSFDRPYLGDGLGNVPWNQSFFSWEFALVRWMESNGYDVTYATDVDVHANPAMLLNYRGLISPGHDEYWSKPMYDGVTAAVNSGVNLAVLGADALGWQIRFEPSSSGVANRIEVCYRFANLDPTTDRTLTTVEWYNAVLNRPQQGLIGVQYNSEVAWVKLYNGYQPYVVKNSGNWVYAGTGFKDGDSVPGLIGYEADVFYSTYPKPGVGGTYTLLSNSPYCCASSGSSTTAANSSVYQAASGAWVFATGTMGWAYALDNFNQNSPVDSRIQRVTANVLNKFVNAGVSADFALGASPGSQTVTQGGSASYAMAITPSGGFAGSVALSVTGLPTGASGNFTPNPASGTSTLAVTTAATTPAGTYTLTITGVNGSLTRTTTVSLAVNAAGGGGGSGVKFDNSVGSGYKSSVTTVTTPAFVVGSGANRAAMIFVAMSANTASNITATLGGVTATLVPQSDTQQAATSRTMIFQVINPPSGSQTATVSWSTNMSAVVGVTTVSGANQTAPVNNGTWLGVNAAPNAISSVTVVSNPGDLTASIGYTSTSGWASPYTNQILKWGVVDTGEVGGDIGPGTGTTTHTWNDPYYFQTHAVSGANFSAAP